MAVRPGGSPEVAVPLRSPAFAAGVDQARGPLNDSLDLMRGQVENRNPCGRSVNQPLAIGGVAVLVEVEACAIGFIGEANHAMAGIGVNPGARRVFTESRYRRNQKGGGETKHVYHVTYSPLCWRSLATSPVQPV